MLTMTRWGRRRARLSAWILAVSLAFSFVAAAGAVWAQAPSGTGSESQAPTLSGSPAQESTAPVTPPPPVPPWPGTPSLTPPATIPSRPVPVSVPVDVTRQAATFQLDYLVGIGEEYSDNFRRSDADKKSNFRTSVSPGLRLGINGAFTKGLITYIPSETYDTSNDKTDLSHSFLGSVIWQATPRVSLTLADTLIRSDEATQADRLSIRRDRKPFTTNSFTPSVAYSFAPITTTAYYRWTTFFEDGGRDTISHLIGATAGTSIYESNIVTVGYEYLNSDTSGGQGTLSTVSSGSGVIQDVSGHRFFGSFKRQLNPLTSAGISGSYGLRQSRNNDFDVWSISLFATRNVGALSLTGNVGYSQVKRDAGGTDSSILTATTLIYRLARVSLTLGVDTGFSETFAEGQNFGVVETRGVTGTLSYEFTPFITATTGGFYRENAPTGTSTRTTTPGGARDENSWGASATVAIKLSRWLSMLLDYSHTEASRQAILQSTLQSTLQEGGAFTENRARISLNASF